MNPELKAALKQMQETNNRLFGSGRTKVSPFGGEAPPVPDLDSFNIPYQNRKAANRAVYDANRTIKEDELPQDFLNRPKSEFQSFWEAAQGDTNYRVGENLALPDVRYNASGVNPARTQRLSRMADALNNMAYRPPGDTGTRNFSVFGNANANDGFSSPAPQHFPQIETEEMRQMQRNRQYESIVQNAEIARRAGLLNMPMAMQGLYQTHLMAQAGQLSQEEIRRRQEYFNQQIHDLQLARNEDYRRAYDIFSKLGLPQHQAKVLHEWWSRDPMFTGQVMAQLFGTVAPSIDQYASGQAKAKAMLAAYERTGNMNEAIKAGTRETIQQIADALGVSFEEVKSKLGW